MSGEKSDSLSRVNVEDTEVLLPILKETLMLQEETLQIIVVDRISALLKPEPAREAVLSKLIKYDIIPTLFDVVRSPADRLLPRILDVLCLASNHRRFYQDQVAAEAVDSMLRISYCASKSSEHSKILERLVQTILNLSRRAVEFGVDLDTVCVPRQLLIVLKSLLFEDTSRNRLRFSGTSLLNVVLEHSALENCEEALVLGLCQSGLDSMREIVEYSDDDASISIAAVSLCGLCACGTRLCCVDEEENGSDRTERFKEALVKSVYEIVMNTLIPYVKNAGLTQIDRIKFHGNLVTCLNNLYKLRSCAHDNLSNHLTANGYLKYFLGLTAGLPENPRRTTCMLLSRIISALAERSMPTGSVNLTDLLYRGFLGLPSDPERWTDVVTSQTESGTSMIVLIYYHFHGTAETDMMSLKPLASRISALSDREPVGPLILKTLWFLFAVAYNSQSGPNSDVWCAEAVKRLSSALQRSELGKCYTHHVDLLRFCLKCPEVPRDLRSKTMDLWLAESDGDIKPLLALDCDKAVRHCLLTVVQNGQPEGIINLAVKGIRELMTADNAAEIAEIAWQMLPSLLASYRPDKDEHTKAILELTTISAPRQLSVRCIKRCADCLVDILLNKNVDRRLRTLAVTQAYVLLVASVSARSYGVLEKYVNSVEFLRELQARSFSKDIDDLSAVCLKLLAFIVHCQHRSSVQCKEPVTVELERLTETLLNGRKSAQATRNGMQLLLELVVAENSDGSAVRLKEITRDRDGPSAVINLCETLHIIHGKSDPDQRDCVYQCLSAVLKRCQRTGHECTMRLVCGLMSNHHLVTRVLSTGRPSDNFLEFASIWLRYCRRYSDDVGPWCKECLGRTPLEETLDRIRNYLDTVRDDGPSEALCKLRYVLTLFDDQ